MHRFRTHNEFTIEPLAKKHDRADFSCGVEALDNYLKKQASQDVARHVAACFVATSDGKTVAGFYTLSQYSVDLGELPEAVPKKLPKYSQVPATLLGRLAVSSHFRGKKLGEFLLIDALDRCNKANKSHQLPSSWTQKMNWQEPSTSTLIFSHCQVLRTVCSFP